MEADTLERLTALEGWFTPEEGERLGDLARSVRADHAIIELGSYAGRSSCWMAASEPDAHITCIDPWFPWDHPDYPEITDGGLEAFRRNVAGGGWGASITPLRSTSAEVAGMWLQPVGLVFIDTIHDLEHAMTDFADWAPHVTAGGVIAFHDDSAAFPGIGEAVRVVLAFGWEDLGLVGSLHSVGKPR